MRYLTLIALMACGPAQYEAESVLVGRATVDCTGGGGPTSIDLPPDAVVQVYDCGALADTHQCQQTTHLLTDERTVAVGCSGREVFYLVRWIAPGGT